MPYFREMNLLKHFKPLLILLVTAFILIIFASIFDIIAAAIYPRFYSSLLFATSFAVAGIFAAVISYTYAIQLYKEKTERSRWTVISMIILLGVAFFFVLAPLEGGQYEIPFKAFGIALAAGSLIFAKGRID